MPLPSTVASAVVRITAVLLGLLAGTAGATTPDPDGTASQLLNRAAFGPAPGDLERVSRMGLEAYVDEQLHPVPEPAEVQQGLDALPTTRQSAAELFAAFGPALRKQAKADEKAKHDYRDDMRRVVEEAEDETLMRAVESPNQLQEVLVDFWFNHFNVFVGKGIQDRLWAGPYEREAIRPHVFGHFRDLLGATAKHPAMLFYLDNWRSVADGFEPHRGPRNSAAKGRSVGLNENYAREVMELHTLGVDGGYTQRDVVELARILTGWTFDPRALAASDPDAGFVFAARRHDHGSKVFLGRSFDDDGVREGERALDLLAQHPATAHHIAFELAQYFVADAPPPALVDRLAAVFTKTDGDLRAVTRSLLLSPEFLAARGTKFKTPYQYIVSSLRASAVDLANLRPALGALRQLGQPIHGCATPDGWKNTQDAWLNPGAMIQRVNFAAGLGAGRLPSMAAALAKADLASGEGRSESMQRDAVREDNRAAETRRPQPLDVEQLEATLGLSLSDTTRDAIAQAPAALKAALLLGSPEFMRH